MLSEQTEFSLEEVAQSATINYQGFMLGSIAFLKARNIPLEQWTDFMAERFASYWPRFASSYSAIELAKATGVILVAGGGRLTLLEGDQHSSQVVVEDYPGAERLQRFGVSLEEIDVLLADIFNRIAAVLHWQMQYHREANRFEFRYWRQ